MQKKLYFLTTQNAKVPNTRIVAVPDTQLISTWFSPHTKNYNNKKFSIIFRSKCSTDKKQAYDFKTWPEDPQMTSVASLQGPK